MPRAVSIDSGERHDLKTLPGDGDDQGYIVAKRLTYGEKLQRRAMSSAMKIQSSGKSKDWMGEMNMINEEATLFDFQRCITDHNLQDDNGNKLDFTKMSDIRKLDPRVGEEIDNILSDMNNFEDDEEN